VAESDGLYSYVTGMLQTASSQVLPAASRDDMLSEVTCNGVCARLWMPRKHNPRTMLYEMSESESS
jgi:hypothetical protein